ncbi:kinase-like protein [Imleria badia]|nr:kinase-like protein [Imleria badia]
MVAIRAGLYQGTGLLGYGSFGDVYDGIHVLTGAPVAMKRDTSGNSKSIMPHVCETTRYPCALPYEAQVYKVSTGETGFPSLRWHGVQEGVHVLVIDKLGPDLDAVRRLCRGHLSFRTVLLLGLQMLERVESVHSRGLILRDVTPKNFVMGLSEHSSIVHLLDFGLVRPFVNPVTKEHIPFVDNLERVGTARYTSHNMLLKRETSRRDDIEALGNVLLFLLRGRLPWQGIHAPSVEAKFDRLIEMRVGKAMQDFIDESPGRDLWHTWFTHCRDLAFIDKPDYDFLKGIITSQILKEHGGADGRFDWLDGGMLECGTLVPWQYKLDSRLFYDDFLMKDLIPIISQ